MIKVALIDVDETLYPRGCGPFEQVNARIEIFVMRCCGLNRARALKLRKRYVRDYGSTLGGLMRHHGVDPDIYLRDVHDVPVEELLAPDARMAQMLSDLPMKLVAFSNGSRPYVERVLDALGVRTCFEDIFTIEFMDFIPKPLSHPYRKCCALYGGQAWEYLVVDDRPGNVVAARDLGMQGVLVGRDNQYPEVPSIESIYALADIIN